MIGGKGSVISSTSNQLLLMSTNEQLSRARNFTVPRCNATFVFFLDIEVNFQLFQEKILNYMVPKLNNFFSTNIALSFQKLDIIFKNKVKN